MRHPDACPVAACGPTTSALQARTQDPPSATALILYRQKDVGNDDYLINLGDKPAIQSAVSPQDCHIRVVAEWITCA